MAIRVHVCKAFGVIANILRQMCKY